MFDFENFVSVDFILSFTGMVVVVSLFTQATKSLFDKLGKNRTKYVVLGWSVLFSLFAGAWTGKFSTGKEIIETCVIWTVNSIIVWFTAMKAYETASRKE